MIAIVDYGMGNIRSVEKGFIKVGADVRVTSDAKIITDAKGIVLPGVGAFRDCIKNLDNLKLLDTIVKEIQKGKPYLGICLGLQILFTESEEFGICRGLDVFKGRVVKFRFGAGSDLKIPHMGWNTVKFVKKPPVFNEIQDNAYFYFVHSYYVVPDDKGIVAGVTEYGIEFTSIVWKDNIFATQFHPEKSQELGLKILKGFNEFVQI
ncbi:imidazole glycerol phosphate synthase subunit HisH [Dissulfurispira thermophila]|uniref:Imidazole glycerol phosphate synthase subunit HisH n=2 Tax=root TaxID=1 RepID=A0A7G1H662_9BACT|nr:imidazole glycerol phosphate synthase subunit HisH [Dissulfurispira thermophila]BCB97237.1 imidazole glycerol phosphate synthase subunit HisH [Dissulfurispira thermophila]